MTKDFESEHEMRGPPKEEHSGSSISREADFIGGARSGVNGTPFSSMVCGMMALKITPPW